MLNWASFWRQLGGNFHRPGNPATVRVVRWPSTGDTADYRLRWPKLTPVSLISMAPCHLDAYHILGQSHLPASEAQQLSWPMPSWPTPYQYVICVQLLGAAINQSRADLKLTLATPQLRDRCISIQSHTPTLPHSSDRSKHCISLRFEFSQRFLH